MWVNPQETLVLVTFTEEILNGNFIFCLVSGGGYKPKDTGLEEEPIKWIKQLLSRLWTLEINLEEMPSKSRSKPVYLI